MEATAGRSEEALTLQSIGDGVIATDLAGRVTRMNPTAEALTGWTLAEARGRPLHEIFVLIDAVTRAPLETPAARALAEGRKAELSDQVRLVSRTGHEAQLSGSATPIRQVQGECLGAVVLFRDASEQFQAQEALRERGRHLQTIIETEPECVKVVDADGQLVEMNAAGMAMLEVDTLAEAARPGLASFIVPAYREAFQRLHQRVLEGGRGVLEFEVIGKRGTRRWLETHAAPLQRSPAGGPMLLGITRDITERKRAEAARERLESQLAQAQKMEAIGQLAGGVAHDFNNLLSIIISTAELAETGLPPGHPVREDLLQIRQAGGRAATLTSQLLAFSRSQVLEPQVIELGAVLSDIGQMLSRVIREDIVLSLRPSVAPARVSADRSQLERVFVNLAINARDAMPKGGTLTIETGPVSFATPPLTSPPLPPGDYVMLSVSDTGVGIDPAVMPRIFEPFFTTKARGQGSGLGLSMVYGIVAQSQGGVEVSSELGHGTSVRIYLPQVKEPVTELGPGAAVATGGGHETVLIVDDEPGLAGVATRILASAGYTTLTAVGAEEAKRCLSAHEGVVHLLLTDVVMPGVSGPALAAELLLGRPGLKVLYTSGYSDDVLLRAAVRDERAHFLRKPYGAAELQRRVREVLDQE